MEIFIIVCCIIFICCMIYKHNKEKNIITIDHNILMEHPDYLNIIDPEKFIYIDKQISDFDRSSLNNIFYNDIQTIKF